MVNFEAARFNKTPEKSEQLENQESLPHLKSAEQKLSWWSRFLEHYKGKSIPKETLKTLQAAAVVFQASTAAAETAHTPEYTDTKSGTEMTETLESVERGEIASLADIYRKELSIYKGLGLRLKLKTEFTFPDSELGKPLSSSAKEILRKIDFIATYRGGECDAVSGSEEENIACALYHEYGEVLEDVKTKSFAEPQPLMELQRYHGHLKIDPVLKDTTDSADRENQDFLEISPYHIEISDPESNPTLEVYNLLDEENPLLLSTKIKNQNEQGQYDVAAKIISTLAEDRNETTQLLETLPSNNEWIPAVTAVENSHLNPEQIKNWKQFIDSIDEISLAYYPEKQGPAEFYAEDKYGLNELEFSRIPAEAIKAAGYPILQLHRIMEFINFKQKQLGDFHIEGYFDESYGIAMQHYQSSKEKNLSVYPPFTVCDATKVCGFTDLSFNASYIGAGVIEGAVQIREHEPISKINDINIFSNLGSNEELEEKLTKSKSFFDGVIASELLFERDNLIANAFIYDLAEGAPGNAGVQPHDNHTISLADQIFTESKRMSFLVAYHETVHAIDGDLQLSAEPIFIQQYLRAGIDPTLIKTIDEQELFSDLNNHELSPGSKGSAFPKKALELVPEAFEQWVQFMKSINESSFLADDGVIGEFGHAEDNPAEFFSSLMNSLQHSNWESKISEMSPQFQKSYLDSLQALKAALDLRVTEERISSDAPIFSLIAEKSAFIEGLLK